MTSVRGLGPVLCRRLSHRLALLLSTALAALPACGPDGDGPAARAPSGPPPNVLLIVVDTLRADHLSGYGYAWPTSPQLDALAARGAAFDECIAQASWTVTSMISLMTGLPILKTIYKLPDEMPLLAERFAAGGYRTGAAVANSVLSSEAGFSRGFQSFVARQVNQRKWSVADLERHAWEFLEEQDGRPWLLWLHYLDTHTPYDPDVQPWDRAPDEVLDEWELSQVEQLIAERPAAEQAALRGQLPDLADAIDRYDAEIAEVDASIGRLLGRLAQRGLDASTLVVVASDHGETLFRRREHPDRLEKLLAWKERRGLSLEPQLEELMKSEHHDWVYRELVRVPLILAGPGVAPGQRIEALTSNLDLQATLLGLCGLPTAGLPGRDLSAALRVAAPVPPADWVTSSGDATFVARLPDGTAVILPDDEMTARFGWQPQQYDLAQDPLERAPRPLDERGRALLERLREARAQDPFQPWQGQGADEETLEHLRELGYVK